MYMCWYEKHKEETTWMAYDRKRV